MQCVRHCLDNPATHLVVSFNDHQATRPSVSSTETRTVSMIFMSVIPMNHSGSAGILAGVFRCGKFVQLAGKDADAPRFMAPMDIRFRKPRLSMPRSATVLKASHSNVVFRRLSET